jgi:cyanate permease
MFTKAQAEAYFIAEKQESLLFIIIGIVAIAVGILFLVMMKTPLYKGIAIPIMAIGLIQCIVGYNVYARSDDQRKAIVYKMDLNPDAIKQNEIPRMETVMKNFAVYRWVEMALLLAGLMLAILYRNNDAKAMLFGIGIGLAIQAALMLGADYFAEKRGAAYLKGLQDWVIHLRQ